jgi:hypothetical protein
MNKTGFTERIGQDHLYEDIDAALTGARQVLARADAGGSETAMGTRPC